MSYQSSELIKINNNQYEIPLLFYRNNIGISNHPNINKNYVIQIVHGMAEYHPSYELLINYFNKLGFDIYIHNHRGHGIAVNNLEDLGFIAEQNGEQLLIDDTLLVTKYIKNKHPDKEIILFSLSMGTLIVLNLLLQLKDSASDYYNKIIFTGSPGVLPRIEYFMFKLLINLEIKRQYKKNIKAISPIARLLVNYGFNIHLCRDFSSPFAWTTRDKNLLQKFLDDARAGFIPKNQFFVDLLNLINNISYKNLNKINKNLKLYFFDGSDDPANHRTKDTKRLIKYLKQNNINNVKHIIYPGARHQLCSDTNREEFFKDLYQAIIDA